MNLFLNREVDVAAAVTYNKFVQVLENGPALGKGHQTWMMNEINKLIWPAPLGIGIMDPELFKVTADISLQFGVIKNPADPSASYRDDLARAAVDELKAEGLDVFGNDWQPATVQVTPNGE